MTRGAVFERRAERILRARGLQVIEKNYRCRLGEIDLICREGNTLVFVEVRYRNRTGFADAAASIDRAKQRRLLLAAQHYLQRRGISEQIPCRIDVVAFDGGQSEVDDGIQWLQNAVTL